jgi:hypothetical protein
LQRNVEILQAECESLRLQKSAAINREMIRKAVEEAVASEMAAFVTTGWKLRLHRSLTVFNRLTRINNKKMFFNSVNFVVLLPDDYRGMLLDRIALLNRQQVWQVKICIVIVFEFAPLIFAHAVALLQRAFRRNRI